MHWAPTLDSFSQSLLNFAQLPAGPDIPRVVTSSLASGLPASPVAVLGIQRVAPRHPGQRSGRPRRRSLQRDEGRVRPVPERCGRRTAAARSSAALPERPFHSLSYPDINYTVMRPANLPPLVPARSRQRLTPTRLRRRTAGDPGVRNPFIYPWGQVSHRFGHRRGQLDLRPRASRP